MSDIEIIQSIENEFNIKFDKTSQLRNIYFDTANKEALCYWENEKLIGLKIKNYKIGKIPEQIKEFKSLSILSLYGNEINDISILSSVTNLKAMNLSKNEVVDLTPIKKFYKIQWLQLNSNKIEDIDALRNLVNLKKLYLDNNKINSLEALASVSTLKELSARENTITTIEPLLHIKSISKINLSTNSIKKITNISKLDNLNELDLSHNKVVNIEELSKLRKLVKLDVSYNKIFTLPDFSNSLHLSINIAFNKISDLQEFSKLPRNKTFNTNGNPASMFAYSFREPEKAVLDVDILKSAIKGVFPLFSTEKAGMIGLFGRWGRGKTFFWKHLKKDLEDSGFVTLEFSAWKYNDTPATWAYFYETLAKVIHGRPRILRPLKVFIFKMIDSPIRTLFNIFLFFILPVLFFIYVFQNPDLVTGNFEIANGVAIKIGTTITYMVFFIYYFTKVYSINVNNIFKQIQQNKFSQVLGMQAEIEKQLIILLKNYSKRLIVFVDDLDRCNEDKILNIIDALRIIIENKEISEKVIIITAVDEKILKEVIKKKYKDLDVRDLDLMVKEYMEKLFVFSLKLPALNTTQVLNIANNYADSVFQYSNISVKTTQEYAIFVEYLIKTSKKLTPRQVKNAYNRYFFSINLFLKKYEDISNNELEMLCAMLFYFSFDEDVNNIDKYIKTNVKSKDKIVNCIIFDKEIEISQERWYGIRNIIETAVAY